MCLVEKSNITDLTVSPLVFLLSVFESLFLSCCWSSNTRVHTHTHAVWTIFLKKALPPPPDTHKKNLITRIGHLIKEVDLINNNLIYLRLGMLTHPL